MPLNSSNFVLNGHAVSADMLQFVQLLTGVMADQPVHIANTLLADGAITTTAGALNLGSGPGASVVLSIPSGNLSFAVGGTVRWAIAPSGNLLAGADNSYDIGATAASRPRNVYAGTALHIGSANETIRNPVNAPANLSIESADGILALSGSANGVVLGSNAYYDGSNWMRFNTGQSATYFGTYLNVPLSVNAAPSGANPIAWTEVFKVDNVGNGTFKGTLSAIGTLTANSNLALGGNMLINPTSVIQFANGSFLQQQGTSPTNYIQASSLTVTPGQFWCNAFTLNGAGSIAGAVTLAGGASLTAGTLNLSNLTIQYCATVYGINNGCYLTNDGTTWTTSGAFNVGGSVNVATTLSCSGALYANGGSIIVGTTAAGVITSAASYLYLRASNGVVIMDGTGGLAMAGPITGVTAVQCASWMWSPTIYLNTSQTPTYFQGAGAPYRVVTVPGGFQSCEVTTGGYHSINASAFNVSSARAYKDNIVPLTDCLERVLDPRVEPVSFMLKNAPGAQRVGFLAEDMAQVVPEVMGKNIAGESDSIHYSALVSVLWGALREVNARLETMEAKLAA